MATLTSAAFAQQRIGDYKESVNNNLDQSRSPRAMQYTPKDGGFFTVNGKNRFTRALYGSNTDYRIETSDKPIFAIYKSKNYRSLRFLIEANGTKVQLDEAEYCEATYKDGMRSYMVKDARWGKDARLYIDVIALSDKEGAIWKFRTEAFEGGKPTLHYMLCDIANKKLSRNGDMGADKPGCFEPSPTNANLVEGKTGFTSNDIYADLDFMTLTLKDESNDMKAAFDSNASFFKNLASRVTFTTPDPYLNTLGGALVLAADGCWDGETWLHGAIGWRMPLAGWRAGYLGDVLGWNDRAISHFDAYAASQVTDVPVTKPSATQDPEMNLARAKKEWGTEMYSTGYICRNPNRNNQMHHYDMNLNYVDELLWHFQYDADVDYMKKMWPVLTRHLAWEKMNFDSDNDHLYDAYCCIWASDALYYSDGAVTHSSAYNYRGNLLAAKIAKLIGEDGTKYQQEADAIRKAMNERLWVNEGNAHWAEYQESMGHKRVHPDAALWSVYTPIDCGVGTPEQMYSATTYVSTSIPHLPVEIKGTADSGYELISTSDWMPYSWSINNVASAEMMHTALAYFEAGNAKEGYKLLKSNVMDQMYLGQSPGNFGQINYYDAARGECYRDFGDNVGISSRALIQGLFGIVPNALDGECVIRPGFPLEWDSLEVKTPYLIYKYRKTSTGKGAIELTQNFSNPLKIIVRINGEKGRYTDYNGSTALTQRIEFDIPTIADEKAVKAENNMPTVASLGLEAPLPSGMSAKDINKALKPQNIAKAFNASVSDIFNQEYLSPRPASTSLELPKQGIGEWCHPKFKPEINDSVFRSLAKNDIFTIENVSFRTPQKGNNIVYTSLWDNYPETVTIPVKAQKAGYAHLLLAGSTNHMQTRIENAVITANYADGTCDTLKLIPPFNWCPIEQDYYVDNLAFKTIDPRPIRVCFGTGTVSRDLGKALNISPTEVYGREVPGGAGQMLTMQLDPSKKVKSFTLTTVAPDVVIGIMAITLR